MSATSERCGIYCRQSDPGQSTLPEQQKWARSLAGANGWPVAIVAEDDGLSGDDLTRAGLAVLEAAFQANHKARCPITRLIVQKTDRLSRSDSLDAFETLAKLRRYGLRYVVTTLRTLDLNNALDRTLYAIEQDHSNNPFLATMAERALSGMLSVSQAGFWVGRIPLGYRLEKKPGEHGAGKRRRSGRLVIDPETAPIVHELFERYAAGESTTDLADWLTAHVRPPSAVRWSAQTVRQLLMNDVYIGTRTFGKRARGKHVRLAHTGPVPQEAGKGEDNIEAALVMRNAVPAVVDEGLFDRVQQRLASGRRRGHHKETEPLPLSGLGRCGGCRGVLHAVWAGQRCNGRRVRRLVCANRMRYGKHECKDGSTGCSHDYVLRVIFDKLAETMLGDGVGKRLTVLAEQRADEAQRQAEASRSALLRRIADLEATLLRSQRRLAEVAPDMLDDLQAGLRQLRQERDGAKAELQRQEEQRAVAKEMDPVRLRAYWELCQKACDVFRASSDYPPSLRTMLAELVDGFTLQWGKDRRGRATPQRVDVELPGWITALASNAIRT